MTSFSLLLVIVVLGVALVILLLSLLWEGSQTKHLRATSRSVADLLNYAALIDDGIIVQKDGALMAAWEYECADHESSTVSDLLTAREMINRAFSHFGGGWAFHLDCVRRAVSNYPATSRSFFPDPVTRAIDEERRSYFEKQSGLYESKLILTVTYYAPLLTEQKLTEILFDDDNKPTSVKERHEAVVKEFKNRLDSFESRLSAVIRLNRLKGRVVEREDGTVVEDDFVAWLSEAVTGKYQPVVLPRTPVYMDTLIGKSVPIRTGFIPVVGKQYVQVVAIEGLPTESFPGMLSVLSKVPGELRWSTRFIAIDRHQAEGIMDFYRKKWRQKVRGIISALIYPNGGGPVDRDALSMENECEDALAAIRSERGAPGFYTSTIILRDSNRERLEQSSREIEKLVTAAGFIARIEDINTMDAFLGSLPGHTIENVTRPLIDSLNLADLIPSSTLWTGSRFCPCPFYPPESPPLMVCEASGSTPFRLNLHVGDVGHTLIFGPTGSGKSTLIASLYAQARRYPGMKIFAFDKGMSLYPLTASIQAFDPQVKHYEVISETGGLRFAPLSVLNNESDLAWAAEWVETCATLSLGHPITSAQRNHIFQALQSLRELPNRSLTVFVNFLADLELKEALKPYTLLGAMGRLLDSEKDEFELSNVCVFEIEQLMNLGEKYLLPILLYLFRRVECALDGSPAIISIDEAWIALGHDLFREKIREWLKVLRKANCSVILSTQSISDADNSGILDVLVESTATQIFLPNPRAEDETSVGLYRKLGLNAAQIRIIAKAAPKREYYATSAKGRRLFSLALQRLSLAFVGVSDKEQISLIRQIIRTHSKDALPTPAFVQDWLSRNNLPSLP